MARRTKSRWWKSYERTQCVLVLLVAPIVVLVVAVTGAWLIGLFYLAVALWSAAILFPGHAQRLWSRLRRWRQLAPTKRHDAP